MKQLQTNRREDILARATAHCWGLWRLIALLSLWLLSGLSAQAADYTFSDGSNTLPKGCRYDSPGNYTCGALTFAAGDTATIGATKPATITFTGAVTLGAKVFLNSSGNTSDLSIVANGAVTLGAGSSLNANLTTLGAGAVTVGADSWITGNVSTETGFVVIGAATKPTPGPPTPQQTGVGGNLSTVTGYVSMGADSIVNGSITTQSAGYVVLGANAKSGAISVLGAGYVVLGADAIVNGSIAANGTDSGDYVTTGAGSIVSGSISTAGSYITLGERTQVSGNISTKKNYITVGANCKVDGQVSMNDPAPSYIGIGAGSKVYAVCCNGKDDLCVSNASGITPKPLVCLKPPAVDHIQIEHSSGTGLTCSASTLTARACADAACTTTYTGGVSGTFSATGTPTVNWDGSTGGAGGAGFVIASGNSTVTKNVQVATAGSVVFGIATASPVPSQPATCNFGNPSCTFTASTAGFIFANSATGSTAYTFPPLISGASQNTNTLLWLRAVQASTANAAVCTPAIISQTVPVNMGYACSNPTTCKAGSLGVMNATPIAPAGTLVNLAFDANGSAPITSVRYDDVGQIAWSASKTLTPFSGATAVTLTGSSNTFVVKPHHFLLSSIQQTAVPNLTNPAAADASGAQFIKAGEPFSVTVTARNAMNGATPNYGQETAPEGVKLVANLVAPSGGTNPALANPSAFGTFSNGVATGTTFSWSEVGIIHLTPSVADADYLGAGDTTGTVSENVGRFIPDHFETVVALEAGLPMPCPTGLTCPSAYPGFVYSGQSFKVSVTAMNGLATPTQTSNYDGTGTATPHFAKAVTLTAWDAKGSIVLSNPPGAAHAGTPTHFSVAAANFTGGVGTVSTPSYKFATAATRPTDIYIRAMDSDAVSSRLATTPSNSIEGGIKVVSGRLKVANGYGSELLPLPLDALIQYYTGSTWITSDTDSVTTLTLPASFSLTPSGTTVASMTPSPVTTLNGVVTAGKFKIYLGKPTGLTVGAKSYARILPTAPLFFLTCNTLIESNTGTPPCPSSGRTSVSGVATFGLYKSPIIYRRENY